MKKKGMIHGLGGTEQGGMGFHHTILNGMHFKTYELFISGIFPVMYGS